MEGWPKPVDLLDLLAESRKSKSVAKWPIRENQRKPKSWFKLNVGQAKSWRFRGWDWESGLGLSFFTLFSFFLLLAAC